jgi:hypothetical protein
MSIRSKRAPLLRDLEANRTAVRGPRCDSLDRLLCERRRVKAEPETSKPSEPPERRQSFRRHAFSHLKILRSLSRIALERYPL